MIGLTRRSLRRIAFLSVVVTFLMILFYHNVHKQIGLPNISSATSYVASSTQRFTGMFTKNELMDRLTFKDTTTLSNDELVQSNMDLLQEILKIEITEPKVDNLVRAPDLAEIDTYERANATLCVLVRNKELPRLLSTIKQIEKNFNNKFHYPYVFLNEVEFSEKFINTVSQAVSGEAYFETIDPLVWNQPNSIDVQKQAKGEQRLKDNQISYAGKISYHNMCRYYSRSFYDHPRLQQFKYYWRFEPNTDYFCEVDYDIFKFMQDNNKRYGFVINIYDSEYSVENLWPTTLKFIEENPQLVNPNGAFEWLTENLQNPEKTQVANGYSTCHFWTNFEIADMDFYRSEPYRKYVDALEAAGGFYYERWGDAPVHSIGVGLFMDKSEVHWFRDIGYKHQPYINAPNSAKCNTKKFSPGAFTYKHLYDQNCMTNWIKYSMTEEELTLY